MYRDAAYRLEGIPALHQKVGMRLIQSSLFTDLFRPMLANQQSFYIMMTDSVKTIYVVIFTFNILVHFLLKTVRCVATCSTPVERVDVFQDINNVNIDICYIFWIGMCLNADIPIHRIVPFHVH